LNFFESSCITGDEFVLFSFLILRKEKKKRKKSNSCSGRLGDDFGFVLSFELKNI